MPFKSGRWGLDAKKRSKRRQEYFQAYRQEQQLQCSKCGTKGPVAPSGLCKKCIQEYFPLVEVTI